ncbi:MAG: 16S rRNA (uracil(1498)-N(3))-methyltransferase [Saprospiraceae bacterium]|nr:16S rRNA (uracil(1498)-N(3))-methyltransferase [Saprospiraceae bacterium]
MTTIFYSTNINNNVAILEEEEAIHCVQVLRKKNGDTITLTDGKGFFYEGIIIRDSKKRCEIQIVKSDFTEQSAPKIHIGIAPTKNIERIEWFLEKATETGISEVSFLQCHHSERQVVRIDRLEKVVISAMKQSMQPYKPILNEMCKLKMFLSRVAASEAQKFIAHLPSSDDSLLKNAYQNNRDVIILIGPEGDFSDDEVNLIHSKNFTSVSLGKTRLRTETAALLACHSINFLNQ